MFGLPIIPLGGSCLPEEFNYAQFVKFNMVPIQGRRVTCGLFGISDDYIEKYQSLDTRFIKNKASTFFFQAASSSMEPLIFENDVLVVDRSIEASSGKVVIVSVTGELVCKRLIRSNGRAILRSDNKTYKDILVSEDMDMVIFGVVIAIARELS